MSLLSPSSSDAEVATADVEGRVERVRWFARLLDESIEIPVVNYRIGIEPIVGLLPKGGDLVATLVSLLIVVESYRLGAGPLTLARMLLNLVVDSLVGSLPLVGDVFDFAWKANMRNARLLERAVLD